MTKDLTADYFDQKLRKRKVLYFMTPIVHCFHYVPKCGAKNYTSIFFQLPGQNNEVLQTRPRKNRRRSSHQPKSTENEANSNNDLLQQNIQQVKKYKYFSKKLFYYFNFTKITNQILFYLFQDVEKIILKLSTASIGDDDEDYFKSRLDEPMLVGEMKHIVPRNDIVRRFAIFRSMNLPNKFIPLYRAMRKQIKVC